MPASSKSKVVLNVFPNDSMSTDSVKMDDSGSYIPVLSKLGLAVNDLVFGNVMSKYLYNGEYTTLLSIAQPLH